MREKFKEGKWTAYLGLQTLDLRLQASDFFKRNTDPCRPCGKFAIAGYRGVATQPNV
jgi:hypothetical protein